MFRESPALVPERGFFMLRHRREEMGLTGSSLNRFRSRVDAVLLDAFPCLLIIGADTFAASGPGSRVMTEYREAGEAQNFRFPFRVSKAVMPSPVAVGDSLIWQTEDASISLEVIELSMRPHEDHWQFVCRHRRA